MITPAAKGMRLLVEMIMPLLFTEKCHGRLNPANEYSITLLTFGPKFLRIDLEETSPSAPPQCIGGFSDSCDDTLAIVVTALEEDFDECRKYISAHGCELSDPQPASSPYDMKYVIKVPNPEKFVMTKTPMEVLTEYYLPLFLVEYGARTDKFTVEVFMNNDPCSCENDDCDCDYKMSDIMMMLSAGADDEGSTINSRLVTKIRSAFITDFAACAQELERHGYKLSRVDHAYQDMFAITIM